MNTYKISCSQANGLDLVDYLESLGHKPQKIRNNDYWYPSPLREEKEASFKVNRKLNVWYDHGSGQGGNMVDFGTLYHRCSVSEFLQRLNSLSHHFPFHLHTNILPGNTDQSEEPGKIAILAARPISYLPLLKYLHKRAIPPSLANRYCKQTVFELYGKKEMAIGFQNNGGGYELRSERFKASSSPKDVTMIDQNAREISVFEGFFSFLSFQAIHQLKQQPLTNFLVLNSLAFFEKSRPVMEKHAAINLYLDRDAAGLKATQQALAISPKQYRDCSHMYTGFKDLNDQLTQTLPAQKQHLKIRRSF